MAVVPKRIQKIPLYYDMFLIIIILQVSRRGPAEGFGAEGEEEPTSEEVRAELKRLYVQLEILRNQTLRRDNPHISKRRGGRKPPHRRFSLQVHTYIIMGVKTKMYHLFFMTYE